MQPKCGIIFDMDGTLWDSSENVAVSWNLAIKQYAGQKVQHPLTTADMQRVMGMTMEAIADNLFAELSKDERMRLMHCCCEVENDYLREHGGVLYPQVEETLAALHERYPLYIVSNCQSGYIEAFLDYYDFWKYIDDIACYGDNLQPKAENIRLLTDRNKLESAVYVGDIQADYDSSAKAGIGFIHAAYGFGTVDADVPHIKAFSELKSMHLF